MSLLALTLLFGLLGQNPGATAQNGTQPPNHAVAQWDFLSTPPPQFSGPQLTPEQRRALAQRVMQQAAQGNQNTCYAMRTYFFRREDGNAPVLVGTTTCTPADIYRRKNAGPPPVPKLIPLSY
jgi:hypothetical protein